MPPSRSWFERVAEARAAGRAPDVETTFNTRAKVEPPRRFACHRCGKAAPCARPARWKGDRAGRSPGLRPVAFGGGLAADSCGGSSGFDAWFSRRTGFPLGRPRPAHLHREGRVGSLPRVVNSWRLVPRSETLSRNGGGFGICRPLLREFRHSDGCHITGTKL